MCVCMCVKGKEKQTRGNVGLQGKPEQTATVSPLATVSSLALLALYGYATTARYSGAEIDIADVVGVRVRGRRRMWGVKK